MAKIYGQLEKAQLENVSSDGSSSSAGKIQYNTTTERITIDNNSAVKNVPAFDTSTSFTDTALQVWDNSNKQMKYNGGKIDSNKDLTDIRKVTIGTNATSANNAKLHRNAAAELCVVDGSDSTADGSAPSSAIIPLNIELIQDFTTINSVGTASQQYAGHIWATDEGGTGTDLAYYKFASGSMTTDEEGSYTLTANGSPSNTNGITGSDYAADFDGSSDYYTQGTLLDSPSSLSNGIAIDFWIKPDDGQPASTEYLFEKENVASQDILRCVLNTDGTIDFVTEQANAGEVTISSSTKLPDGSTDWYYICVSWDTTYGMRLWINGAREAQDADETTLLGDGTDTDFFIGAESTPGNYYAGLISLFRVRDMELTQKDVDLGYSVRYTAPSLFASRRYSLRAFTKEDGSDDFEAEYKGQLELARNDNYLYLYGGQFSSSDKLRLEAKM